MTEMALIDMIRGVRDSDMPDELKTYVEGLLLLDQRCRAITAEVKLDPDHEESPKFRRQMLAEMRQALYRQIEDRHLIVYTDAGEAISASLEVVFPLPTP